MGLLVWSVTLSVESGPIWSKASWGSTRTAGCTSVTWATVATSKNMQACSFYGPLRRVWVAQNPPGLLSSRSTTRKIHGKFCVSFTEIRFVDVVCTSSCRRGSVVAHTVTLRVPSYNLHVPVSPLGRSTVRASPECTRLKIFRIAAEQAPGTVRLLSLVKE
ncbi:hypothetical protein HPB50_025339 [Hyalomma asiaticum]|uniref:Uncharacterized protein n=1 Tax=Hyalomma asiaticum TaxID=266040 RepID=A0ACB7S2J9_HYAAI|nr:hypothetical protein HPB50_025339 [Hyalomma asiaticum]